jgi:integrase
MADTRAPKRIEAFMGHALIQMTYDVYGYLFKDGESDALAAAKLESALFGYSMQHGCNTS